MWDHNVTCHPSEVRIPPLSPAKRGLDLATPEGCKVWNKLPGSLHLPTRSWTVSSFIMLGASSGKRYVTVWRPSVCLSVPSAYSPRDSPGGSMYGPTIRRIDQLVWDVFFFQPTNVHSALQIVTRRSYQIQPATCPKHLVHFVLKQQQCRQHAHYLHCHIHGPGSKSG